MSRKYAFNRILLSCLLLPMLLSACTTPPKRNPAALQKALQHINRGIQADTDSSFANSEAEFLEAYRLYSVVENYPGMLTALLNLSKLYRGQGDIGRAVEASDKAVALLPQDPSISYEIFIEKGRVFLCQGKLQEALALSEKAVVSAPESEKSRAIVFNAEALLRSGQIEPALAAAATALKIARASDEKRSEATALRIYGENLLAAGKPAAADENFTAALAIDKDLALSKRIAEDLDGLSKAAEARGDLKNAAVFLQRRIEIWRSSERSGPLDAELERLASFYDRLGEKGAAAKIRSMTDSRRNTLQRQ